MPPAQGEPPGPGARPPVTPPPAGAFPAGPGLPAGPGRAGPWRGPPPGPALGVGNERGPEADTIPREPLGPPRTPGAEGPLPPPGPPQAPPPGSPAEAPGGRPDPESPWGRPNRPPGGPVRVLPPRPAPGAPGAPRGGDPLLGGRMPDPTLGIARLEVYVGPLVGARGPETPEATAPVPGAALELRPSAADLRGAPGAREPLAAREPRAATPGVSATRQVVTNAQGVWTGELPPGLWRVRLRSCPGANDGAGRRPASLPDGVPWRIVQGGASLLRLGCRARPRPDGFDFGRMDRPW